jgi:HPt (histidine-containing phosphotransfer) domain-containing protein
MDIFELEDREEDQEKPQLEEYLMDSEYRPLVLDFIDGLPERKAALEAAALSGKFSRVRLLAHKMVGAGLFCLYTLEALARDLEESALAESQSAVNESFKKLSVEIAALLERRPYL